MTRGWASPQAGPERRAGTLAAAAIAVAAWAMAGAGCAVGWGDAEVTHLVVGPDDRTLEVGWHCHPDADADVDVEEDDDQVRLTLRLYDQAQGDCAHVVAVRLDQPLGDRELVDAVTGEVIEPSDVVEP